MTNLTENNGLEKPTNPINNLACAQPSQHYHPHHHSQPQVHLQTSSEDFTLLSTHTMSASTATIDVPYLTINRVAYSLSSFNKQFRRLSQLPKSFSALDDDKEINIANKQVNQSNYAKISLNRLQTIKRSLHRVCRTQMIQFKSCSSNICSQLLFSLAPLTLCRRHLPVIEWLAGYKQSDLLADLMSGLTIGVFHVPECMGYSFLANINPIYCLYSSLFPSLIYAFTGTSQYCSIGTFAALAIMTGTAIKQTMHTLYVDVNYDMDVTDVTDITDSDQSVSTHQTNRYQNVDIAITCTFIVGIYLLLLGILRLGFISVYMSEQFLNGFTCSVAYHVLCSQLPHMLGLPRADIESSNFTLPQYLAHIYRNFGQINLVAVCISVFTATLILSSKRYIDPWLRHHHLNVSFPIEFLVVLFGVMLTYLFDLDTRYNLPTVGTIQSGLPEPTFPPVSALFGHLWLPCISIAVVAYVITYSVGRTFYDQDNDEREQLCNTANAKVGDNDSQVFDCERSNEIDSSQELVALGLSNLFGSFFSCIPCGASLSRSSIQFGSGGRTQLVSIVNCIVIFVFLYISSLFATLPNCILATIISVALKGLLANVSRMGRYWQLSRVDASVWMVTFASVVLIDISWGLYLGLLYSLFTLIYKSQLPHTYLLGTIFLPNESTSWDFFVPLDQYVNARELTGIKIFQFCGPLHFANVGYFFKQLEIKLNISIKQLIKIKTILLRLTSLLDSSNKYTDGQLSWQQLTSSGLNLFDDQDEELEEDVVVDNFPCLSNNGTIFCSSNSLQMLPMNKSGSPDIQMESIGDQAIRTLIRRYNRYLARMLPNYLVIDCTMFSYIDIDGVKMLRRLIKDFDYLNVKVFLGGCPSHVGKLLERSELDANQFVSHKVIYISVCDAIEHARQEMQECVRTSSRTPQSPPPPRPPPPPLSLTDSSLNPLHTKTTNHHRHHHQVGKLAHSCSSQQLVLMHSPLHSTVSVNSLPFSCTSAPSSLFSTESSISFTTDWMVSHHELTVPTVIELPPSDDFNSLSIEEEIVNANVNTIANHATIEIIDTDNRIVSTATTTQNNNQCISIA